MVVCVRGTLPAAVVVAERLLIYFSGWLYVGACETVRVCGTVCICLHTRACVWQAVHRAPVWLADSPRLPKTGVHTHLTRAANVYVRRCTVHMMHMMQVQVQPCTALQRLCVREPACRCTLAAGQRVPLRNHPLPGRY